MTAPRSTGPHSNPGPDDPLPAGPGDRPAGAPRRTIHMIGNSHLDLVWLWPWQEAYQEARATFASVLDRMDEYPDFVFTCDQIVLLAWVEEQDPALFDRIRARVVEGRWVNTGGWWVEPDCNLPIGESLARQGLVGQRFLESRFGRRATVGMNADPFGHAGTIPQILVGQRMGEYCFLRPMAHELALPPSPFRWEAPDGSSVVAYRIPFEYQTAWTSVDRHVEKAVAELPPDDDDLMIWFGVGDHGGGPTKAEIETVHRFDRMGSFGALRLSSPPAYFAEALAHDPAGERLPVVRGDLQHHSPGCYSAHSGIKIWMRRAQSALLVAERWAAVLQAAEGIPVPAAELARAWRSTLENQFHDLLPGTAIEAGFIDARDQLGEATAIAKRITARAHNVLASRIAIPLDADTQPVVVFNPHPWPVVADVELHLGVATPVDPDRVTDEAGERVLSQPIASRSQVGRAIGAAVAFRAELPPLGHRLYRLHRSSGRSGDAGGSILRGPLHLENERIRLLLDPDTGDVASLIDLATGVDLAAAAGPHVQISPDPTDTWGHRVVSYAWPGDAMTLERIRVREDGALRAMLRVERRYGASTLAEEYLLAAGADHVEVRIELDWQERAHVMKLRWAAAVTEPVAETEIPYGSVPRPVDGAEQPSQSWVDLTGTAAGGVRAGLSVVNDAKHGVDFSPAGGGAASIGQTAVRSPVYAWHDPTPLDPDGVYRYQDQGEQRWTVLLVPHGGDPDRPDLHRRAAELNIRPRAMLEGFHDGEQAGTRSFAAVADPGLLVTAVKPAEDAEQGSTDVVLRVLETAGEAHRATIDLPVLGRALEVAVGPRQLRSWRIPLDPAAPTVEVDLLELPLDG